MEFAKQRRGPTAVDVIEQSSGCESDRSHVEVHVDAEMAADAHKYRLQQAREILDSLGVISEDDMAADAHKYRLQQAQQMMDDLVIVGEDGQEIRVF